MFLPNMLQAAAIDCAGMQADQRQDSGSDDEHAFHLQSSFDSIAGARKASKQCKKLQLPPGPNNLADLFKWHERNAKKLLCDHENKHYFLDRIEHLMQYDIELHESFSGLGTAGITLHQQHQELQRVCYQAI